MTVADIRHAKEGEARIAGRVPLRGTQSFVSVMVQIWKRPGLTGIELLWRWAAGMPLLWLLWHEGTKALRGVPFDVPALEAMTVFKPTEAIATVSHQLALTLPPLLPIARWWLPLAVLVWAVASAFGRTVIWRRIDPALRSRYLLLGLLGLTRSLLLIATFGFWMWGLGASGRYALSTPAARGAEPNIVLFVALGVALTLLLFVFWSLTSWVLDAAPLFAMDARSGAGSSLAEAMRARLLASKLIETNLVMGIVKVALLVLAMVFSACPLPFASVETTSYLLVWWSLVGILFLAFLDLFHVVRRAAYLALYRAIVAPAGQLGQAFVTPAADITRTTRRAS